MKKVSFSGVESLLNHYIDNNIELANIGEDPIAVNLVGDAGIGKTSIVRELAKKRNMNFSKLNLAQLDEIGDLMGYPMKEMQVQMFKLKKDGDKTVRTPSELVWTTEDALKTLHPSSYQVTNRTRTSYAKPSWIPEYNDNGSILLLDDFTRCTPVFAQAIMDLMLEQKYTSWKLPKKTTIILTSNPDNGNYNVTGMDAAQNTRCVNFLVDFDADTWAQWAEKKDIDGRCISFALNYADELFNCNDEGNSVANPRSYTMFCNSIRNIKDWDNPENLDFIQTIAQGCFSDEKGKFGAMFATFIANRMHLLIPPKDLLMHKWDTIKDKLYEQIHKDGRYETGVASLIERRFTNYVISWLDSDEPTPGNTPKSTLLKNRIVEFIDNNIFTEGMYFHMIQNITKVHKAQTGKLLYEPKIANKVI